MNLINISYPTPLNEISNIDDDNIDIIVELNDGNEYILVVATPQNLLSYMDKEGRSYLEAGCPFVIVRQLTEENIIKAIKSYIEHDAYWLKLYHLATELELEYLNKRMSEYK